MKINVIKNAQHLGYLDEDESGLIHFVYNDEVKPEAYLPGLSEHHNEATALFPVFENLLPEMGMLELLRHQHAITRKIDLLLHLSNIHGSFHFCLDENLPHCLAESTPKPFIFSDVKKEILGDYTFPNILERYTLGVEARDLFPVGLPSSKVIGLSGYQYKFSVAFDQKEKVIRKTDSGDGDYFMKPYNKAYTRYQAAKDEGLYAPYLLLNEHLFMSYAKSFGFSVPYNAIIQDGTEFHYLIKRYDRFDGTTIDHCEFLTLMGKRSEEKYKVTLKEAVETVLHELANEERQELFRFLVFSVVIAHGDLHAKNLSLIYRSNDPSERKMQLAPYYDISTTAIYRALGKKDIGLKIRNKVSNITMRDLLWLAAQMKIDETHARSEITAIGRHFIEGFLGFARQLPDSVRSLPVITNRYGTTESFEALLIRYHRKRCDYIKKMILGGQAAVEDIWI